ncbi:hypothetical protein Hanom_Chr15g01400041 [Helianthus anomalus]
MIHAMGHRKEGYDVSVDYIMCMVTALIRDTRHGDKNALEILFYNLGFIIQKNMITI